MNILAVTAASILFLLCACSHEPVHESYTEPQHSGVDRSPHRTAEAGPSNHPSSTQFHTNLLSQINHYRARSGLKPLSIDKRLTTIAKARCSAIAISSSGSSSLGTPPASKTSQTGIATLKNCSKRGRILTGTTRTCWKKISG